MPTAVPASSGNSAGEAHRSCVGELYEAGVAPRVPPKREKVHSAPTAGSGEKLAPLTVSSRSNVPPLPPPPPPRASATPPDAASAPAAAAAAGAAAAAVATAAAAGATAVRVSGLERSKTTKRADEGDHVAPPSSEEET